MTRKATVRLILGVVVVGISMSTAVALMSPAGIAVEVFGSILGFWIMWPRPTDESEVMPTDARTTVTGALETATAMMPTSQQYEGVGHAHDPSDPFCAVHPDLSRHKPNLSEIDPDQPRIALGNRPAIRYMHAAKEIYFHVEKFTEKGKREFVASASDTRKIEDIAALIEKYAGERY